MSIIVKRDKLPKILDCHEMHRTGKARRIETTLEQITRVEKSTYQEDREKERRDIKRIDLQLKSKSKRMSHWRRTF